MAINFSADRWQQVRMNYMCWWAGELERPLIAVQLSGVEPSRPQPAAPLLTQATCADFTIPAADVIDRLDYELSRCLFLGDAFPYINLDCFGPGVMAAMLGAKVDNSTGHVWFSLQHDVPISDLHFTYNPDNPWLQRVKELCATGMRRWQGQVLMGMTDLGGTLDVLSTFRPGEKLLFDLVDYPDEVKRLVGELHALWHQFYQEINSVLQPTNPGYTDWSGIYCDRPSYILQSDFSYMIGPAMFNEFVLPELTDSCGRLEYSFYHLDGIGQLPHLDTLLAIKELNGVQWIPGDGSPTCENWPDVYRSIHAAGKLTQVVTGSFDTIDAIIAQVGTGQGLHRRMFDWVPAERTIRHQLEKYGIG